MFTKKIISVLLLTFSANGVFAVFADSTNYRQPAMVAVTEDAVKVNYIMMADAVYSDSLSAALALQDKVQALLNMPTPQTLEGAKSAYKLARIPYQQSEIMRWDTDITINSELAKEGGIRSVDEWEGQVNAWPLDEQAIDYVKGNKKAGIINHSEGPVITLDYLLTANGVGGEANITTGFHAIEFLLWGQDLHGTQAGAGERNVNDFQSDKSGQCSAANCDRRRTYLSLVTLLLVDDLTAMQAEWTEQAVLRKGTLANNFIDSKDAIRYMFFAMKSMATDELASARMNEGLDSLDPEQEHDCFSDLSHVAIYYNFQGIRNAFYGGYQKTDGSVVAGASLADLIHQQSPGLYKKFDDAFNAIEKNMLTVFKAGEQSEPIRFDQIIAQGDNGFEKKAALAAVYQLVDLQKAFDEVEDLLSLQTLIISGDGD